MDERPISTWTRFKVSTWKTFQVSIFQPLLANKTDYHDAFYGPIAESPAEYVLVIAWKSYAVYDAFTKSKQHEEMMANLKALSSSQPQTQVIDFGKIGFWWRLGPNTEVMTVHFPDSVSPQTRDEVSKLRGLVLSMGPGIDGRNAHLSPYKGVPACGWIVDSQSWDGKGTLACMWCHYWKDKEAEEKFKATEKRPPKNGESYRPLVSEAFKQDLKGLGAVGWKEVHVDFNKLPNVL
ncbi:hypothetical protein F4779DRAFT_170600 [Xylariaceae sp. FL0662B]|nr:hypothetical protein F4779DRAFT_170600 [Xylariaceae sp. FL0662B]